MKFTENLIGYENNAYWSLAIVVVIVLIARKHLLRQIVSDCGNYSVRSLWTTEENYRDLCPEEV